MIQKGYLREVRVALCGSGLHKQREIVNRILRILRQNQGLAKITDDTGLLFDGVGLSLISLDLTNDRTQQIDLFKVGMFTQLVGVAIFYKSEITKKHTCIGKMGMRNRYNWEGNGKRESIVPRKGTTGTFSCFVWLILLRYSPKLFFVSITEVSFSHIC